MKRLEQSKAPPPETEKVVTFKNHSVKQEEVSGTFELDEQAISAQYYRGLRHSRSERYVFSAKRHSLSQNERFLGLLGGLSSLHVLDIVSCGHHRREKTPLHCIASGICRCVHKYRKLEPTNIGRIHEGDFSGENPLCSRARTCGSSKSQQVFVIMCASWRTQRTPGCNPKRLIALGQASGGRSSQFRHRAGH
jgi:hypothetical protein